MQMVLWHLTRAPVQPGRLALLLIMATSLGMFGGTFGATLDKSFDDRASYQSGAALRLADLRSGGASVQMLEEDLADAPGIEKSAYVVRANASFSRGALDVTDASVLGIDPDDRTHTPGTDICAHLARHGVTAEARRAVSTTDIDACNALLNALADDGAGLLVMGAYGRHRMRELLLGGMTRDVLRHMTVPVLMSH